MQYTLKFSNLLYPYYKKYFIDQLNHDLLGVRLRHQDSFLFFVFLGFFAFPR